MFKRLAMKGMKISTRQGARILAEANEAFIIEARDGLRAGLDSWRLDLGGDNNNS